MVTSTKDFKIPQNFGMRTRGGVVPMSGKPHAPPIGTAFPGVVAPEDLRGRVSAVRNPLPANRRFGIFPLAKAASLSNDARKRASASHGVMSEAVNDQRQATSISTVAGLNYQRRFSSGARFANYPGNAADEPAHISTVKHADDARLGSPARYVGVSLAHSRANPLSIEAVRRAEANAKILQRLRR